MAHGAVCVRFHQAIELIGGRWTGPILRLLLDGPARFAGLRDAIPNISDRMLSERLHYLESEGLVVRTVIPESPIRVEYALSQKGKELQASLDAVGRWAEKWIPALESQPRPEPERPRAARRVERRVPKRKHAADRR